MIQCKKTSSLFGIRFLIEFSSVLVMAFLCIMHEMTDVTLAKQVNIDHASGSNQASNNFADEAVERAESSLTHLPPSSPSKDQSELEDANKKFVRFTPESLDFGNHPISIPVIETVYVHNARPDELAIQMISISGNTEHFHCSFFEDKIVPALSNTTFQVVFLARQEGLVSQQLFIHSSVGSFQYGVSAFGEASPFRVRPLIGARVPLNSSFASLIYIYNPFSTPLQLTEMYTSGGGLHLELPGDKFEALSALWKVPPYETRPVMKAHFVARIASNHTSYIRIRTNASDAQLMLPVEVEVSNSPGLYTPLDTLDFGVLRSRHDPPKVLPIQVINAAMKFIYVQNIVVTPLSDGLSVENFNGPVKLPPRTSSPHHVADLLLDPQQFTCTGLCIGKVLIKSKNNQYKLSIPFVVRIIQGELHFNSSLSHFFINESSISEQRTVIVENRFDSPVLVHEIVFPDEAKPYFKLTLNETDLKMPLLLPKGKPFSLLTLEFTPSPQLSHFSTVFRLMTNFSYFDLPLFAYRGRLDLFIPNSSDQTKLDLGLVGLNEQKSSTFVVSNHNPISIQLVYWQCDLTGVSVEFVGTSQGNVTALNQQKANEQTKNLSRSEATLLQPNHFAVFRVHINKLTDEGAYLGQIKITTLFESLSVQLQFNVVRGSLKASKVVLPKTFPGRIVSAMINVKSNYTSEIKLKGAFVEPPDDRFKVNLPRDEPMTIKPGEDNHVHVLFDASAACHNKICYSSLDIEKEVGQLWLLGSHLYTDTAYIDKELYRILRGNWMTLTESDKSPAVNIRLQVDGFGSFITEAQAQLSWPRLSNKLSIRFPSIRIGRYTAKELVVENPADRPILIQALQLVDYPNIDILLQVMGHPRFHQNWTKSDLELIEEEYMNSFNATSVFAFSNSSTASAAGLSTSNRINEWLGVTPKPNSFTMILPPGARQRLIITFHPKDEKNFTSLLVLRNNLTVIDVVLLRGEGGRGLLKIGQTLPNSSGSKLLFEFSENQLERKCLINAKDSGEKSTLPNNGLVIKEKFKATNVGRMGMQIRNFFIDGTPCEGFGFHLTRCEPLFLQPNQSFDIEIVYSPDFTTSMVSHELTILVDDDTHLGGQKFKLVASIPQKYLRACLQMLPRPVWESFIYYLLVMMALFVLLLSIIVAISDAHRITSINEEERFEEKLRQQEEEARVDSQTTTLDSNKKLIENGHSTNGKAQQQHQPSAKLRNRKGNKGGSGSGTNPTKSSFRPSNLIPSGSIHKFADSLNSVTTSKHDDSQNKNMDWENVIRKKPLVRQDSTSSELSQRSSSDISSISSSSRNNIDKFDYASDFKDNSKKSSTSSLGESLQASYSTKMSISHDHTKQKDADQLDKKAIGNDKKSSSSSTKSELRQAKNNEIKTSNLLEKATSLDAAASTKFSSESLQFSSTMDLDHTTKVRSATLPLSSNESKSGMTQSGNGSISQPYMLHSGMSGLNEYEEANESGYYAAIGRPNRFSKPKKPTDQLDNLFMRNNTNQHDSNAMLYNHNESSNSILYNLSRQKDIWDSPINSFDPDFEMNMLVRQTEEFASQDNDKLSTMTTNVSVYPRVLGGPTRKVIAPPPGLPIPVHQRHDSSSSTNSNITQFREDKWEIGEWSNDLANMKAFKTRCQQEGQNKFAPTSNIFSSGDSIRDLQFQQAAAKSRNFTNRFGPKEPTEQRALNYRNSFKSAYPVGHSLASVISPGTASLTPAASIYSSLTTSSTPPLSSSSTFSPVIGRPNPPTTSTVAPPPQASRLFGCTSNSNGSHFGTDSFGTQSSIDSSFSLKSDLLTDLDWTMQPSNLATQYQSTTSASSAIGHQSSTLSDPKLNSLFAEWNATRNLPMDSFNSDVKPGSFLNSTDCIKQPSSTANSKSIFDFGPTDTSVWNSPTSWTNFSNDKGQSSNAKKGSDKTSVTKWPSPPSGQLNASPSNAISTSSSTVNNRVWSPFDPYRLNSSPTLCLADSIAATPSDSGTESVFEAPSVFELFGGKSPWSPLGSSPLDGQTSSTAKDNSSLSETKSSRTSDHFFDPVRLPPNPSPTSSHHSNSSLNSTSNSSS